MNDLVRRLRHAYQRELDLYREVEVLGLAGVEVVRTGRPLGDLNDINRKKQRHLNAIAEIENGIAGDKQEWRNARDGRPFADALDPLLEELRQRIESILEIERETERGIVEGSGVLDSKAATP